MSDQDIGVPGGGDPATGAPPNNDDDPRATPEGAQAIVDALLAGILADVYDDLGVPASELHRQRVLDRLERIFRYGHYQEDHDE